MYHAFPWRDKGKHQKFSPDSNFSINNTILVSVGNGFCSIVLRCVTSPCIHLHFQRIVYIDFNTADCLRHKDEVMRKFLEFLDSVPILRKFWAEGTPRKLATGNCNATAMSIIRNMCWTQADNSSRKPSNSSSVLVFYAEEAAKVHKSCRAIDRQRW
jgi:hypothetical protein